MPFAWLQALSYGFFFIDAKTHHVSAKITHKREGNCWIKSLRVSSRMKKLL